MTRIIALVGGGLALCLLAVALWCAASTATFLGHAASADGRVIALSHIHTESGYQAVIEFTTAAGHTVQYETGVNSDPPEFAEGQSVRVYYSPDDPAATARADSFISLWFLPALFGFLAAVAGGIGVVAYLVGMAERGQQAP